MSPTVPTYGGRRVATEALPNVRVPTSAPQGAFESGLEQAAPAIVQASAHRDAVTQKAELDADELAVNTAKLSHYDGQNAILQDPNNGALNMRGINALGALPAAQEQFKKLTTDITGKLTNDRQRAMFDQFARGQYGKLVEQVSAHTSAEVRKADTETTSSLIETAKSTVDAEPEKSDEAITEVRKQLIAYGQRQGWDPATLKLKDALHTSDIRASAISAYVQRGTYEDAQKAEQYLKAHRSDLKGKQLDDAEKLVDTALGEGSGYAEADKILGINQASSTIPSDGQKDETVTPRGTAQQEPATSRAEALARAEAIKDPRARKAATDAIMAHFTRMETVQRLDRQEALTKVVAQVEASGGRLNRASKEYQMLVGHPEETHAIAAQERILRPPKDPGDPELFMSHLNMATISPATREHFLQLNFTGKDGQGLNTSQRTRLIQMQAQYRGQDTRHEATSAVTAETLRFQRESALLKVGDPNSSGYIPDKAERDAEVSRIKRHFNQLQTAHGGPAPSTRTATTQPQAGTAAPGAVDLADHAPDPTAHPVVQPTRQMLEEAAQSPAYAAHLRALGVQLPAVLPAPVVKQK